MTPAEPKINVKLVGANGQISLGKKYAGRQILVEELDEGVWMLRTATVIPDNEKWLHTSKAKADIEAGLKWHADNPARKSSIERLAKRLDGKNTTRSIAKPKK